MCKVSVMNMAVRQQVGFSIVHDVAIIQQYRQRDGLASIQAGKILTGTSVFIW
jgi:hypothetical protein